VPFSESTLHNEKRLEAGGVGKATGDGGEGAISIGALLDDLDFVAMRKKGTSME
jgi:hypothetical protein